MLVLHVAAYVVLDAVALVLVAALVLLTYVDYAREAVARYFATDLEGEIRRLRRSMPEDVELRLEEDGGEGSTSMEDVFFHVERGEPELALAALQLQLEDALKSVAADTGSVSNDPSAIELYQVLEFGGGFEGLDGAPDGLSEAMDWMEDLVRVSTRGVGEGVSESDAREMAKLGLAGLAYVEDAASELDT